MIEPIVYRDGALLLLDQRLLPEREEWLRITDTAGTVRAIADLVVRGAPAIGVTAAYGLVLGAAALPDEPDAFASGFEILCGQMVAARPTAVNLAWAVERMRRVVEGAPGTPVAGIRDALLEEAQRLQVADVAANRALGGHGAKLLTPSATVLTHCNAGALATAGYGTALGVIRAATEAGKAITVLAGETRPYMQGARLTAWELQQDGIPCTILTDSMAGHLMQSGKVDAVVVGADRIAANGDVANKIGTYTLAVLAREHGIPFYVAAPTSTVDLETSSGAGIPIEQRDPEEVLVIHGRRVAPSGVSAEYPAFDITPARFVTAIITEAGVAEPPFENSLRACCAGS